MAKRKWIKKAIKRPGALRRKAKAKGMTVSKFCSHVKKNKKRYSSRTRRQCGLAKTLSKFRRRRKRRK